MYFSLKMSKLFQICGFCKKAHYYQGIQIVIL